jgi:hypothetical protein
VPLRRGQVQGQGQGEEQLSRLGKRQEAVIYEGGGIVEEAKRSIAGSGETAYNATILLRALWGGRAVKEVNRLIRSPKLMTAKLFS